MHKVDKFRMMQWIDNRRSGDEKPDYGVLISKSRGTWGGYHTAISNWLSHAISTVEEAERTICRDKPTSVQVFHDMLWSWSAPPKRHRRIRFMNRYRLKQYFTRCYGNTRRCFMIVIHPTQDKSHKCILSFVTSQHGLSAFYSDINGARNDDIRPPPPLAPVTTHNLAP